MPPKQRPDDPAAQEQPRAGDVVALRQADALAVFFLNKQSAILSDAVVVSTEGVSSVRDSALHILEDAPQALVRLRRMVYSRTMQHGTDAGDTCAGATARLFRDVDKLCASTLHIRLGELGIAPLRLLRAMTTRSPRERGAVGGSDTRAFVVGALVPCLSELVVLLSARTHSTHRRVTLTTALAPRRAWTLESDTSTERLAQLDLSGTAMAALALLKKAAHEHPARTEAGLPLYRPADVVRRCFAAHLLAHVFFAASDTPIRAAALGNLRAFAGVARDASVRV